MNVFNKANKKSRLAKIGFPFGAGLLALTTLACGGVAYAQDPGITPTAIRVGSILDLDGESKARGLAMQAGLEAALKHEKAQGRLVELAVANDSFTPKIAVEATKQLVQQGVFAMLGNTGGPSVKAELPLLAENKVPAVGFPIGVDYLRLGTGDILNFRASFAQEAALIMETALAAGVKAQEICAYLPNDAGGIGNLKMIKATLAKQPNMAETVAKIDQIIAMPGEEPERNGIGPVGFFTRHTQTQARPGYDSLKQWEKTAKTRCRLVMLVGGTNPPTSSFIGYSRYKNEKWLVSVMSQIDAPTLLEDLNKYQVADKIILTQVVPAVDAALPIVDEARKALGSQINNSSLEGYMVGKMFLAILRNVKGEISRANFLSAARGQTFDLGGFPLDFTSDNQGSDFVQPYVLDGGAFKPRTAQQLQKVFQP